MIFGRITSCSGSSALLVGPASACRPLLRLPTVTDRYAESLNWVWTIVQGVVSVLAGIIALIWPGVTALALLFVVAFWAIVLGIGEIGGAFASRSSGSTTWGWTLAAGILNVVFGVVLLIWPASGILTLVWLVGIFTLAGGIALVIPFRVRSVAKSR